MLRDALAAQRVHHCWVFAGPQGVGKFTTARAFAQLLLDGEAAPNLMGVLESPPESTVARLVASGSHPDLHEIRKELALHSANATIRTRKLSNIPVDVLREHMIGGKLGDDRVVDGPAYRTAQLGHGKVFIVDEAELLDHVGQNALLKTLEEPPPQTYIILVTARPERLLPTILSRSAQVRFGTLSSDEMQTWIAQSGLELDDVARDWVLRFADGSPGAAQLAAEYDFFGWWTQLAPMVGQLWSGGFPTELGATLGERVETFATTWVKRHDNASKDAANKHGVNILLEMLSFSARDRLVEGGETARRAVAVIECVRDAERSLHANVNMKQVLEDLVGQWSAAVVG